MKARIKYLLKNLFKSAAQRQQEENERKKKMCAGAVKANVCCKDCTLCSWAVRG